MATGLTVELPVTSCKLFQSLVQYEVPVELQVRVEVIFIPDMMEVGEAVRVTVMGMI